MAKFTEFDYVATDMAKVRKFKDTSLFLLTPPWARGTSISPRALHKPLLLHYKARWVRVWVQVEVEARAHKPRL